MHAFGEISSTLLTSYKRQNRPFNPRRVKVGFRNPRVQRVSVQEHALDLLTEKKVVVSVLKHAAALLRSGFDYKAECYWRSEGKRGWPMSQGLGYRIIKHRIKSQKKLPSRLKRDFAGLEIPDFEIEWIITDLFGQKEYLKVRFGQKDLVSMEHGMVYSKHFPELIEVNFHHLRIARAGQPDFVWPLFNKDSPIKMLETQELDSFFDIFDGSLLEEDFSLRMNIFFRAFEEHLHGLMEWMRYFIPSASSLEELNLVINRLNSLLWHLREHLVVVLESSLKELLKNVETLAFFDQLHSKVTLLSSYKSPAEYALLKQELLETLRKIKFEFEWHWPTLSKGYSAKKNQFGKSPMFGSFFLMGKCPTAAISQLGYNQASDKHTKQSEEAVEMLNLQRTKNYCLWIDEDKNMVQFKLQRYNHQHLMKVGVLEGILLPKDKLTLKAVKDTDLMVLKDWSRKTSKFAVLDVAKTRKEFQKGLSGKTLIDQSWIVIPELPIPSFGLDLKVFCILSLGAVVSYNYQTTKFHNLSVYPFGNVIGNSSSKWIHMSLKDWLPQNLTDCQHQRFHAIDNSSTIMMNYNAELDAKMLGTVRAKDNVYLLACRISQESNSLELVTKFSLHVAGKIENYDWFEHKKQMFHIVCFSDKMSQFFLKVHAYHKQRFVAAGSSETGLFHLKKLAAVHLLEDDDLIWGLVGQSHRTWDRDSWKDVYWRLAVES